MWADDCSTGKSVFKALSSVVGPVDKVTHYFDDSEENTVDIASFVDLPEAGLITYSTVTMHVLGNEMDGRNIPIELMVIARAGDSAIVDVLIEAAFAVGKAGWLAVRGVVFPDFVSSYFPDTTTPHLMWMEPFVWPELAPLGVGGVGDVSFLMGLPLTQAEVDLAHVSGFDALESALETGDVPYTDLWRRSTV